ncbi:ParB/RepB/Spo0J family partition protein [Pengzhenrongella sp.]|jgi:ParB family chromosome partitioning protein|uniref:ParB/RepB/Spo0J family partition protein n=1 Tax=Pengzhenrongella sp. TaxID=2888820 RepID=UPI002F94BF26
MHDSGGFLQLDRSVDSITVGVRHRKDLGDLGVLARSIQDRGLLQPITVTPDGALVCGLRRLEAIKQLGWRTTNVWVRRVSEGAQRLLAEQDENAVRKPYTDLEAEELYREIKTLLAEEAERHQAATRFGTRSAESGGTGGRGVPDSGTPRDLVGDSRKRAAQMVTGNASHTRMEQIGRIRDIAADPAESQRIREVANTALERIRDGHPVNPAYQSVRAALGEQVEVPEHRRPTDEELDAMAEAALERIKATSTKRKTSRPASKALATTTFATSQRMWVITFRDLDGWLQGYDPSDLATSVTVSEWAAFERVLVQMTAFAEAGRVARDIVRATV